MNKSKLPYISTILITAFALFVFIEQIYLFRFLVRNISNNWDNPIIHGLIIMLITAILGVYSVQIRIILSKKKNNFNDSGTLDRFENNNPKSVTASQRLILIGFSISILLNALHFILAPLYPQIDTVSYLGLFIIVSVLTTIGVYLLRDAMQMKPE